MLCDTCINARAILSENGWHRVCSLSSKSASRCIIGEKSQYIKNFAMCDGYPHEECQWGHEETPDANDFCSYGERKDAADVAPVVRCMDCKYWRNDEECRWKHGETPAANDFCSYGEQKNGDAAIDANAAPVGHGRWIRPHWKNSNYCCDCSECGGEAMHRDYQWHKNGIYPICPNCGARMDGGADNG